MEIGLTSTKECFAYVEHSTTECPNMNLSKRQLRTFRRINAKLHTVPAFYVQHFAQIMQYFRRKFRRLHNLVNATRLIKQVRKGMRRQRVVIASRRFRRRGILRKASVDKPKPKLRIVWQKRKGKSYVGLCDIKERRRKIVLNRRRRAKKAAAVNKKKINIATPVPESVPKAVDPKITTEDKPEGDNIFLLAMGSPLHETIYENQPIYDAISDIQFARVIEDNSDELNPIMTSTSSGRTAKKTDLQKSDENFSHIHIDFFDSDKEGGKKEINGNRPEEPIVRSPRTIIKMAELQLKQLDSRKVNLDIKSPILKKNTEENSTVVENTESDLDTSLVIDESFNTDLENDEDATTLTIINGIKLTSAKLSDKISEIVCDKSNVDSVDMDIEAPSKTQIPDIIATPGSDDSHTKEIAPPNTSEENGAPSSELTAADLNNQLRKQLSFFKMGKRKETILGEPIGGALRVRSTDNSRTVTPSLSRNASHASIEDHMITTTTPERTHHLTQHLLQTPSDDGQPTKGNFIDSLINRIKLNTNIDAISTPREHRKSISTPQERNNTTDNHQPPLTLLNAISKKATPKSLVSILQEDEVSDHSETHEFLGFNATETSEVQSGLLPTPRVSKASSKSAFVSEALDTFMKENSLENAANVVMPVVQFRDDALISSEATPPSLTCPQLPTHIEKPRTLAAKREQLEGQTDVKLLMIENESSVFRELKKRTRADNAPNYRHIRWIQDHDIPFTRECWRATSWLATRMGRYYYQTMRTKDGQQLKVFGGIGNYEKKCLLEISSDVDYKNRVHHCPGKCRSIEGINVGNLSLLDPTTFIKKHVKSSKSSRQLSLIKPNSLSNFNRNTTSAPLSKKKLCDKKSLLDLELGPLQVFNMPSIHLEVWPKLEDPLPDQIRPYLKMAMPFDCMTPKWVNFALTALKVPLKENYTTLSGRSILKTSYNEDKLATTEKSSPIIKTPAADRLISYVFDIPYENDQKRLLIRKRKKLDSICSIGSTANGCKLENDECLSFDRGVDANDPVAVDVAGMMRGMLNAVEISATGAMLWKDDPDFKVSVDKPNVGPLKQSEMEVLIRKETSNSMRIRKELKRLNATIIDNYKAPVKLNCTEDFCKLGCVCDSLAVSKCHQQHCKKLQCMFECSCNLKSLVDMESRNSNIEQLRNRATACLAKEEKEFRATVVLSQDRTIYIPNHENVGKRNKRVPKRFHDSVETPFATLDPFHTPTLRKHKLDANEDQSSASSSSSSSPIKRTRLQTELHRMPHCNVSLLKMPSLSSLEPWCMVHCLYKCYCKLRATSGKPFTFDEPGAIITEPEEPCALSKKRQYTFEKPTITEAASSKPNLQTDEPTNEKQSARTRPFKRTRPQRTQKEIQNLILTYRTFEDDHPSLKKLLNLHKRRCWLNSGTNGIHVIEKSDEASKKTKKQIPSTLNPKDIQNGDTITENVAKLQKKEAAPPPEVRIVDNHVQKPVYEKQPDAREDDQIQAIAVVPKIVTDQESSRKKHEHNMKYFNFCVNKTMDQVKNAQLNTVMVKNPEPKNLNCIQWNRLVELFSEEKIFVWEIQLKSMEIILGLTVENVMPLVPGALSVMNIKVVSTARLALVAKLLKQGLRNANTAQLAVLLFGASNYWQIISLIHSNKNYLQEDHRVQPTPTSHPQLASKIAKLFAMLTQNRNSSRKFAQSLQHPQPSTTIIYPQQAPTVIQSSGKLPGVRGGLGPLPVARGLGPMQVNKTAPSMPVVKTLPTFPVVKTVAPMPFITESVSPMPVVYKRIAPRPVLPTVPVVPAVAALAPLEPSATPKPPAVRQTKTLDSTFVALCNITMTPDRNIASFLPVLPEVGEHKWFMLTFGKDFTHIYIRSWKSFLSHDKIKSALEMAQRYGKTVKISAPNIIPDVFAAPNEPGKVFFGPYAKDASLDMGLYFSINGKIQPSSVFISWMARNKRSVTRSTGCWLKVIRTPNAPVAQSPAIATNEVLAPNSLLALLSKDQEACSSRQVLPNELINSPRSFQEKEIESDDDCMIVESPTEVIDIPEDDDESNEIKDNETPISNLPKMISLSPPTIPTYQSDILSADILRTRCLLKSGTPGAPISSGDIIAAKSDELPTAKPTPQAKQNKIGIMASLKKTDPQTKAPKTQTNPATLLPLGINFTPSTRNKPEPPTQPTTTTISSLINNETNAEPNSAFLDISTFPSSLSSNITIFRIPSTDEPQRAEPPPPMEMVTPIPQALVEKHFGKTMRLPKSLVISKLPPKKRNSETSEDEPPPSKRQHQSDQPDVTISECIDLESDDDTQLSDADEDRPKIKGYLVSALGVWMGRIVAHIRKDNHFRAYILGSKIDAIDLPTMNKLLEIQLRKQVYAVEPRSLRLEWTFVAEEMKDHWVQYPQMLNTMFSPTMVITEHGLIDLRSDFESNAAISRELLLRLLVLKLAYLCRCDSEEVRSKTFSEILKKGETQVKSYISRDAKFQSLKMSWALKLRMNQAKLLKLQQSLGETQKKIIIRKAIPLAEYRKGSGIGVLPMAASLQPLTHHSQADVIEIDDEE